MAHFISKLRVEAIVADSFAPHAVKAIMNSAKTGHQGEGKVFVTTLAEVYKISTGKTGADAL